MKLLIYFRKFSTVFPFAVVFIVTFEALIPLSELNVKKSLGEAQRKSDVFKSKIITDFKKPPRSQIFTSGGFFVIYSNTLIVFDYRKLIELSDIILGVFLIFTLILFFVSMVNIVYILMLVTENGIVL